MSFFSTTLTTDTASQNLMKNRQGITKASQISISVRSMGTATYIAFGGVDSQDRRLTIVGESISISGEKVDGQTRTVNPSEIFVISDSNDAVLEIFGEGSS